MANDHPVVAVRGDDAPSRWGTEAAEQRREPDPPSELGYPVMGLPWPTPVGEPCVG